MQTSNGSQEELYTNTCVEMGGQSSVQAQWLLLVWKVEFDAIHHHNKIHDFKI